MSEDKDVVVVPEGTRMVDTASPFFSTMIIDWLDNLSTSEQIRIMKLLGVPGDRREAYLAVLESKGSSEVATRAVYEIEPAEGKYDDHQELVITPTMAISGLPSVKNRPKPIGNRDLLARPTIDLTRQKPMLPPPPTSRS
jgi:hypothetical protein